MLLRVPEFPVAPGVTFTQLYWLWNTTCTSCRVEDAGCSIMSTAVADIGGATETAGQYQSAIEELTEVQGLVRGNLLTMGCLPFCS